MGVPAATADLASHDLIGGDAGLDQVPAMVWMFEQAGGKAPATRSNSMSNLVHAVNAGMGIAPLPCVVADTDTRFVRCTDIIPAARASAYVMVRRELKDIPRVRALIDALIPYMQTDMKVRLELGRRLREQDAANDGDVLNASKFSSPA